MNISAPSSGLPLLLTLEEGKWHDLEIDFDSVEDGKNDKGWNCYRATIDGNDEEIPFWAMAPFYDFCNGLSKKESKGEGTIQYRRTVSSKKGGKEINDAEFRS